MTKYLSLDIETTGLDPTRHHVLEVGFVLDDLRVQAPLGELPRYHAYVLPPGGSILGEEGNSKDYVGDPFALALNADILNTIARRDKSLDNDPEGGRDKFLSPYFLARDFEQWCLEHGLFKQVEHPPKFMGPQVKFVAAGKNVAGFDLPFLRAQCQFDRFRIHHRVLDPAMMYFNPAQDDVPPDLKTCLQRAGLPPLVTHKAIDDALQVVQLVRHAYPLVNGVPTSRQIAFEHA